MTGSAIEVRGVHREYGSGAAKMVALNGVDLSIPSGSFVSVIGPSGCGKSTMLRLIAGLETPDDGDVSVYGVSAEQACAAKMIGLVPQAPALLPWLSVLSNVTLPQKVNRGAAKRRKKIAQAAHRDVDVAKPDMMDLLRKAGLGDATHKLPSELSGGMQQRAAIVRAFGLRPDVLLMDEPFSALDEFTRESLQGQLLDMWEGLKTTVVFVTHSVGEAVRLSDTVVVMAARPGRITDIVPIDLPRPRDTELMKSREFHDLEDLVRDKLRAGWGMHAA
ncbi:ABC transporter ATP-binding protein [Actinosynnema pretiosum subsp. pretiosum]|uniref:ABC transporter related n=2 Tax=Actinosynnema TaxID=40566 RepID=C6WMN4_ACTMD|nr:ABC transporter ATP-binding protein [Actinosynnema mirum]ACU36563.1 ABC transporter related [Actinosynnema mirum DSM 43827]AXX30017.1 Pyrimidine ABC transporter, ATP-binding protein [Actinosynnema pretiosum subsp. pretiosum]QUF05804.1 ABC transporter ATP-binding protein [Actinosynnema pretiosum subsp. pretiosum]